MHPNPAFRADDDASMLRWAAEIGFAHILIVTRDGPMAVHAPIVAAGERAVRFHIARGNRAFNHLDGAATIASVAGANGYITPNWYANAASQVPTWNYLAVELQGTAHAIDEDGLVDQLDALARTHEPRVIPDNPWTRDKMDEARFRTMLGAIAGFEIAVTSVRATRKLSQNKPAADRARVIAGLDQGGNHLLADAMRRVAP